MAIAESVSRASRAPLWVRRTRVLEVVALVVIGVASLVEFVVAGVALSPTGLVAAAGVAAGTLIGYRYQPHVGLAMVALSPLLAAVTGWPPIHNWSIACFAGLLLTLRGLPGLLTGLVVGVANLAAVGWHAGTLSVVTNAERHGEGPVSVRAGISDETTTIEVVNLRRTDTRDTSGGGNGLVGMRERAESVGGTLTPNDNGRVFSIRANLPATRERDR